MGVATAERITKTRRVSTKPNADLSMLCYPGDCGDISLKEEKPMARVQ